MTRTSIPTTGDKHAALLKQMAGLREGDADWHGGKTWSLVYDGGDEHHAFLKKASQLFFAENALNPMAFQSLRKMELDVIHMSANMLNGDDQTVGTMTSGGTESLLLAICTYRDRARRKKPWIVRPNVVLPRTAHPAFEKAAHYFGVSLRFAKCDEHGNVDVKHYKRLINRNTVACIGSAPQYVTGSVDPIPELSGMALKKGIPFHVDACFGGYILPWLERLEVAMPEWDFRSPGVTSISADIHKYGYAPKGSSVLVYRDMSYLKHQFFISTNWPGGIYASPSLQGTRPGSSIAAAWASMRAMGESGYIERAKEALAAQRRMKAGIEAIEGIRVLGPSTLTVVTWAADAKNVDVYAVADILAAKGWEVSRQQHPASVHCTVNARNSPVVDEYVADLAAAVAHVRAHPELATEGEAAMYGMMAKIPVRGLVTNGVRKVMEQMYGASGEMPDLAESDDPMNDMVQKHVLPILDKARDLRERLTGGRA
ncbi:MAG: sphinganine-1-phosphate aldolase [Myxococcota bacterium]|jgi:glutamate/tyrosine decarboxylase-like PLP-dependent enzyme